MGDFRQPIGFCELFLRYRERNRNRKGITSKYIRKSIDSKMSKENALIKISLPVAVEREPAARKLWRPPWRSRPTSGCGRGCGSRGGTADRRPTRPTSATATAASEGPGVPLRSGETADASTTGRRRSSHRRPKPQRASKMYSLVYARHACR